MKRKISLLLVVMLVACLAGCGKVDAPAAEKGNASAEVIVPADAPDEVVADEVIAEDDSDTIDEPVVDEEPEVIVPEEEAAPEEPEEEVAPIPEDRAWIDDLYNKLIAFDVNGVVEILGNPELIEMATPYEYAGWGWEPDYETAYRLITSDEKVVGFVTQGASYYAFYSDREESDYGFNVLYVGDKCISRYVDPYSGIVYVTTFDGNYFNNPSAGVNSFIGDDPSMEWQAWHK